MPIAYSAYCTNTYLPLPGFYQRALLPVVRVISFSCVPGITSSFFLFYEISANTFFSQELKLYDKFSTVNLFSMIFIIDLILLASS